MEKKIERTMTWEMYFSNQRISNGKKEKNISASKNVVDYYKTMSMVRGTMLSIGIDIASNFDGKGDISNKAICRAFASIAREMGLDLTFASYHANYFRARIVNAKEHGKVTVRGNAFIVNAILDLFGMVYRGESIEVVSRVNQTRKAK